MCSIEKQLIISFTNISSDVNRLASFQILEDGSSENWKAWIEANRIQNETIQTNQITIKFCLHYSGKIEINLLKWDFCVKP